MSFGTQFNYFWKIRLSFSEFDSISHFSSRFSGMSSSKFRGTRHDAFHVLETFSAALPNFRLNRCFSSKPSFVSTGLLTSVLKFANSILYASRAALLSSVMSCSELTNFTEYLIGFPYLLGALFNGMTFTAPHCNVIVAWIIGESWWNVYVFLAFHIRRFQNVLCCFLYPSR